MEEYSIEKLSRDIKNKKITVPKYQRGAVWKKSQKDELIDSMVKGYPFGSILLYENENKRQIIDGLQRSDTIINFVNNPAIFFSEDQLDDKLIKEIIDLLDITGNFEKIENELINLIKKWVVNNHHTMKDVERMQYNDLVDEIIKEWPNASKNNALIKGIVEKILSLFQDICTNIANIKIPALIYEGDESLLPEIFERINSQGAKLTKQQIYAATWANDLVKIESDDFSRIIDSNRVRYENMLDENMELDDYDPIEFTKNKEVNIFELVFGFGKLISEKYKYLFTYDPKDPTKVESIGFNLINACLVQKNSNIHKLNKNLKDYVGLETESIERFLNKIIEAIEYVDKRLGKGTKFKGNTRSNSNVYPLHTEMQIVSIIATVFINRHVTFTLNDKREVENLIIDTLNYNKNWKDMKNKFDNNVLKIYTMDILAQKWKGSGDKKLDNIIIENHYYNRDISWDEFEQALDYYFNTMNSERNERKQVASPKEPEKLILNLVYAFIFSAADQNDETNYDIEHLAPKNLMKERILKYSQNFSLPISSIGNLCLLPEYENRQKKDSTIYQDAFYVSNVSNINDLEKKYTFTSKDDLDWIYDTNLDEEQFKEAYFNFLNNRYIKMKEKIRSTLFSNQV